MHCVTYCAYCVSYASAATDGPRPPRIYPEPTPTRRPWSGLFSNAFRGNRSRPCGRCWQTPAIIISFRTSNPGKPGIYTQTWDEWLKWVGSTDQSTHIVDTLHVMKVSDDMASVIFTGHTAAGNRTDLRVIVVLTRKQGGQWLITSWTQENTTPH